MEKLIQNILKRINNIKTLDELYKFSKKITRINIFIDDADIISNRRVLIKNFLCSELMKKEIELTKNIDKSVYPSLNKIASVKHCYAGRMGKILEKFPGIDRYLGQVPNQFLQNIIPAERKSAAKAVLDLFAEYALKFNYDFEQDYDYNSENKIFDKALLDLKGFSKVLEAITKQKVKVEFVGCGYNGNGFKVTICGKAFFYKVFYLYSNTEERSRYNLHGLAAEPQLAMFTLKNSFKNTFAKFYFGKVAYGHNVDSFIVSDFIEPSKDIKPAEKLKINYLSISEKEMNKFDNTINGIIVDFGGIRIKIPEFQEKKLRNIVRVILNHINYKHDYIHIINMWKVSRNNLISLKVYAEKTDLKLYKKALRLIRKHIPSFPDKLYKSLLKICSLSADCIYIEEQLKPSDIFCTDIRNIIKKVHYFNLKILTYQEADSEYNIGGHIIYSLGENKHCVAIFDGNNVVSQIRIEMVHDGNISILKSAKGVEEISSVCEF